RRSSDTRSCRRRSADDHAAARRRAGQRDGDPRQRARCRSRRRRHVGRDRGPQVILVVVEHDRGTMSPATWEALAAARELGETHALTIGEAADGLGEQIGVFGATTVHQVHGDVFGDYGPEAWGAVVADAVNSLHPDLVVATGTDARNEVKAHAAPP